MKRHLRLSETQHEETQKTNRRGNTQPQRNINTDYRLPISTTA